MILEQLETGTKTDTYSNHFNMADLNIEPRPCSCYWEGVGRWIPTLSMGGAC